MFNLKLCISKSKKIAEKIANVVLAKEEENYFKNNEYIITWIVENKSLNKLDEIIKKNKIEVLIDAAGIRIQDIIIQTKVIEKIIQNYNMKVYKMLTSFKSDEDILYSLNHLVEDNVYDDFIKNEIKKNKIYHIIENTVKSHVGKKLSIFEYPLLYMIVKGYLDKNTKNDILVKADFNMSFLIKKLDNIEAEKIKSIIDKGLMKVKISSDKSKSIPAPKFYTLSELKIDANNIFGYNGDSTSMIAKMLYDKGLISFPITSISSDISYETMKSNMEIINKISDISRYKIAKEIMKNPNYRYVSGGKTQAITLCKNIIDDYNRLSKDEKNILHLIVSRIIISFDEDYTYLEAKMKLIFNGYIIKTQINKTLNMGWRNTYNKLIRQEYKICNYPERIKINETIIVKPSTYTLEKIIEFCTINKLNYENITYALNLLFKRGLVKYEIVNETKFIIPTDEGLEVLRDINNPILLNITFLNKIDNKINDFLNKKVNKKGMTTYIENLINHVAEGFNNLICPFCKQSMKKYSCECGFEIKKDNDIFVSRAKRELSDHELCEIIEKGKIEVECENKSGKKYMGLFTLKKSENGYSILEFDLPKKKK